MGFRDESVARTERIEVLERELATARDELEAALLRANEVDELRKRVVALTTERDALVAGVDRKSERRARTLASLGAVFLLVSGIIGALDYGSAAREADRRRAETALASRALDASEARAADLRTELRDAHDELARHDDEHASTLARVRRQLEEGRQVPALVLTARVTRREGAVPAASGDLCTLVVRDGPGASCSATLACGATELFPVQDPRAPDAQLDCVGDDGAAWRAGGLPHLATLRTRGDAPARALALDAAARTIDLRGPSASPFGLRLRVETAITVRL